MIELILMLLGLAFGNNNANTVNNDNNQDTISVQADLEIDTSGNTGQKPPLAPPTINP